MIKYSICLLFSFVASTALAEPACQPEWTVTAGRSENSLNISITETGEGGPACDFVLKGLTYLDGAAVLALDVAPARFCPLDAIARRTAKVSWQLPQDLRASGALRLVVNGSQVGNLRFGPGAVAFKGGCQ